ncbi:Bifunctional protein HldE [bioreactor metagenome]|uniref:Bifunctional protein HldE n=1 Tax=bioreactor metagenome TaxID=1076179 RepID=A0A645GIC1_9ZZZZ
MLQLEIPMATNIYAAKYCREQGMTVILDPAPAASLPAELLCNVDIITPNETELEQITGIKPASWDGRLRACKALCDMGVGVVINKAGPDGVYVYREGVMKNYPTYEVEVVDTTAAGDSFNGAFAYAMSCGVDFEPAVDFANLLAAVSTTGFGAQSAMPTRLGMEKARATLRRKEEILP